MNTPPTEFNVSHDGTDPRYRYTAEERDRAASAGHPFELDYGGRKYQGKAILTDDDRVVMLADSRAIGVVPMTREGAATMRTYLKARAEDTCTGVTAAVFGDAMKTHRNDRIAVPGGTAVPLDNFAKTDVPEGVEVAMEPGLQARADAMRASMGNSGRMFSGEFGDGEVRCLTHPGQECEGEMPTCRAIADGGPAPADMRTPLIDPAELLGRSVTITQIAGQDFSRGQRFDPLELERPVETSLAVIYDNEDIAHEVGKIYVYDGAAVIHVVEPSAVKYLQGGGAVELSRDREFAGNPYQPFVDDRGNPVSVLAELEALSTWEGSTDRLEALVARLAKAVMYSHRLLEKRTAAHLEPVGTSDLADLVRQAGGAGYLTHLDQKIMEMRPREVLAEALKFGSEAYRDLGVLRSGRPDSSRVRVEFGTEGYALPIDIAGEYRRADVGSPERIAVLLAGVAGVSDRVRELEEAVESAASRIEVDSESDSIDDRFAAAAEAARLLRRAL